MGSGEPGGQYTSGGRKGEREVGGKGELEREGRSDWRERVSCGFSGEGVKNRKGRAGRKRRRGE